LVLVLVVLGFGLTEQVAVAVRLGVQVFLLFQAKLLLYQ
jgi:hypothetical protein